MEQTLTRSITNETAKSLALPSTTSSKAKALPAPNILPTEGGTTQEFTEIVQARSDLCSNDYRAKHYRSVALYPVLHLNQNMLGKMKKQWKHRDLTNDCKVWT